MLRWAKQKLDRAAIRAAVKSLSAGAPDAAQAEAATRLIERPDLLSPSNCPAKLTFSNERDFIFPSSDGCDSRREGTAFGKYFPASNEAARHPSVVLVHGWNAELHYLHVLPLVARGLNARGLNAILLELPHHLHRRERVGETRCDFICDDIPTMLRATRQAVSDINALLCWARAQGSPRVAVWGFSLGAWLAGLHLCASDAQDAAVLTTPISSLEKAVAGLEFCGPIRAALAVAPVNLHRLNLSSLEPKISASKILVTEGRFDLFVPSETYRELADAWGLKEWDCVPHSHISVLISRKTMRRSMDWLADTLA